MLKGQQSRVNGRTKKLREVKVWSAPSRCRTFSPMSVLCEGGKDANIHASWGFIWEFRLSAIKG